MNKEAKMEDLEQMMVLGMRQAISIEKVILLRSGVTIGHLRLSNINIDIVSGNVQVTASGYLSEVTFDQGADAVKSFTVELPLDQINLSTVQDSDALMNAVTAAITPLIGV